MCIQQRVGTAPLRNAMRENSIHRTGVRNSATLRAVPDEPPIPKHRQSFALHRGQGEITLDSLFVALNLSPIGSRRAGMPSTLIFVMSRIDLALIANQAIFATAIHLG